MSEAQEKPGEGDEQTARAGRNERAEPSGKDLRDRVEAEKTKVAKQSEIRYCPKAALVLESASVSDRGRGVWYARTPHEHTIDDVLSPHYFGQFQSDVGGLRPGDEVLIEPESALWCVRVRVMAKSPKMQQVKTREVVNSRQHYGAKAPAGVKFEWRGDAAKWCIVKGGVDVDAGFDTQDEALSRLEELSREKSV